jgi:hypothetical protein
MSIQRGQSIDRRHADLQKKLIKTKNHHNPNLNPNHNMCLYDFTSCSSFVISMIWQRIEESLPGAISYA